MRTILPALLALAAAGCADVVKRPEFEDLRKDVQNARMSLENKINANLLVYNGLVDRNTEAEKKMAALDQLVTGLSNRVNDLIEQVRILDARVQAHGPAPVAGAVQVRAVDGPQIEQHHVPGLGRHPGGLGQPIAIRGQVRRALADVGERSLLVAARQKAQTPGFLGGGVQVEDGVHVSGSLIGEEGIVLVEGEGAAHLGRLGMQGGVVQFHIRPEQVGHHPHQPRVAGHPQPQRRVQVHVVDGHQDCGAAFLLVHVDLAPGSLPGRVVVGPGGEDPVQFLAQFLHLGSREERRDAQVTLLVVEGDLFLTQHSTTPFRSAATRVCAPSMIVLHPQYTRANDKRIAGDRSLRLRRCGPLAFDAPLLRVWRIGIQICLAGC